MSLPAVTYERLRRIVESSDLSYGSRDDGAIFIPFEDFNCVISLEKKFVRMFGILEGEVIGDELMQRCRVVAAQYNSDGFVPKVYVAGSGTLDQPGLITMEAVMLSAMGLSDSQLEVFFESTMQSFGSALDLIHAEIPQFTSGNEDD